ncbi:MAG: sulfate reduction electron transfer complex DsrMKJOP subunit DsrO [Planctomycetota bacterium]
MAETGIERGGEIETTRRGFLKCAGCALLAAGGAAPLLAALGREEAGEAPQGTRWGMVVDTRKCMAKESCTKCIEACHRVHNVPQIDSAKEEIKWIWKEPYDKAFPTQKHAYMAEEFKKRTFPVLCNQCENPPCVRVCPTGATFRRKDGIVMMDMHRCIGCRYCIVACPYGSRSFNWRDPRPHIKEIDYDFPTRTKGVVEKCNFCAERLALGKPPACVEACEEKALIFGDVNDPSSEIRRILSEKYSTCRKPELGTSPQVFYLV